MNHTKRNAAGCGDRGASEMIRFGTSDTPKHTEAPNNFKYAERRFCRPVSLHTASAWAIERLAHEYALSVSHAATVADLAGIGGRRE